MTTPIGDPRDLKGGDVLALLGEYVAKEAVIAQASDDAPLVSGLRSRASKDRAAVLAAATRFIETLGRKCLDAKERGDRIPAMVNEAAAAALGILVSDAAERGVIALAPVDRRKAREAAQ